MNIGIKVRTIDSLFSGEYTIYAKTYHALAILDFVALHSHLFQPSAKLFGNFPSALHFSHPCRFYNTVSLLFLSIIAVLDFF